MIVNDSLSRRKVPRILSACSCGPKETAGGRVGGRGGSTGGSGGGDGGGDESGDGGDDAGGDDAARWRRRRCSLAETTLAETTLT